MNLLTKQIFSKLESLAKPIRELRYKRQYLDAQGRHQLKTAIFGLSIDHSRQLVDEDILDLLLDFYRQSDAKILKAGYLNGEKINLTEKRASLHMAMRDGMPSLDSRAKREISIERENYLKFADEIRNGSQRSSANRIFTDIVHIGIGGSHLGQELAVEALTTKQERKQNIFFLSNIDSRPLIELFQQLRPETTLFLIASKSFSTTETKINSLRAKAWFLERTGSKTSMRHHFAALTSNAKAAEEFGIHKEMIFEILPEIGGRFSIWSPAGLPIALSIGSKNYKEMLSGARRMDEHFSVQQDLLNLPLLTALISFWNYNLLACHTFAVLCYDQRLRLLPQYLQQLFMESNGKSVTRNGEPCNYTTMPIVWGGQGTSGQHAYHQLLHQGTSQFAADFITVRDEDDPIAEHRNWLNAHAEAQSEVMSAGWIQRNGAMSFKNINGHHPHSTIVINQLGPSELGALLAYYEHVTFYLGALWDINSFDQWGVERGKSIAAEIFKDLNK